MGTVTGMGGRAGLHVGKRGSQVLSDMAMAGTPDKPTPMWSHQMEEK